MLESPRSQNCQNHGAVFLGDEPLTAALTASLLICQIPLNNAFSFAFLSFWGATKTFLKSRSAHTLSSAGSVFCGWLVCYFAFYVMLWLHTQSEPIRGEAHMHLKAQRVWIWCRLVVKSNIANKANNACSDIPLKLSRWLWPQGKVPALSMCSKSMSGAVTGKWKIATSVSAGGPTP